MICCPIARAASCTFLRSDSVSAVFGFSSMPIVDALGTSWRNSSSRFAPNIPDGGDHSLLWCLNET